MRLGQRRNCSYHLCLQQHETPLWFNCLIATALHILIASLWEVMLVSRACMLFQEGSHRCLLHVPFRPITSKGDPE